MKIRVLSWSVLVILAAHVRAGDFNVVGNLNVASNLTAGVVTLRGATDLAEPVLDFAKPGVLFRYTLTNDTTWVFSNHSAGRQVWLEVAQDATGGWSNTWPAALLWPGGHPVHGANCAGAFSVFKILDDGEHWLGQAEALNYVLPCTSNCHYALQFDGAQNYVEATNHAAFYPQNAYTLELWFKVDANPTGGFIAGNFAGDVETGFEGYMFVINSDNSLVVFYSTLSGQDPEGLTGGFVVDGAWHHVAATWDGSSGDYQIFTDGVAGESKVSTNPLVVGSAPLTVGKVGVDGGITIDDVRLSSVVRYNGSFSPPSSLADDGNTVAHWKFDEGSGTTAHDGSGNGHDGTLQGSPPPEWQPRDACLEQATTAGAQSSRLLMKLTSGLSSVSLSASNTLGRIRVLEP
jgi:hypothetical protein